MMDWTPSGRARFDTYMAGNRERLLAEGADPEEVAADLRVHVETLVAENGRSVVTEEDVAQIAGGNLGGGGVDGVVTPRTEAMAKAACRDSEMGGVDAARVDPTNKRHAERGRLGVLPIVWVALFGIVLPTGTLGFELLTRACATILFDPLPTPWHAVAVALVPLIYAGTLTALLRQSNGGWRLWGVALGLAAGISLYYAFQFLPFLPFAVLGIVFGIGLLPLSPLLAYLVHFTLRGTMRARAAAAGGTVRVWPGLVVALALLVALDIPKAVTYTGLIMATSENPATAGRGIGLLRRGASDDQMLRLCYQRPGVFSDVLGMLYCVSGNAPSPEEARTIFYRAFGEPFNSRPPPALGGARDRAVFEWDPGVAGDTVDGRLRSLSLTSSRLDASVDPDGGVAYAEWTLEFKNSSYSQQEARMQVRLPNGGVVSRLTLWVDGEPREAAFAGRSQVKDAYRRVVSRRQDPVLVTTSGPDRVLVQCFPVPPNGGLMKIRFGVTAPVAPLSATEGGLALPRIVERNFTIPEDLRHALWVESPNPIAGNGHPSVAAETFAEFHALRGRLPDQALEPGFILNLARSPEVAYAWTADERAEEPRWIVQRHGESLAPAAAALVVVVDGSRPMRAQATRLAEELGRAAIDRPVSVVLATDTPRLLLDRETSADQLEKALRRIEYTGGMDNLPALLMARELASRQGNCPILWLHGPQPIEMTAAENLIQHYERRPGTPPIVDGQLIPGSNRVAAQLYQGGALRAARDDIHAQGGITRLVEEICGVRNLVAWERRERAEAPSEPGGKQTSDHLARLFVRDQIDRLLETRTPEDRQRALELAARYQLVTPVSGAVVLETAQQYRESGLEPVSEHTVPTIPEPETWAMLAIVGAVLALAVVRKKVWKRHIRQ